MNNDLISRSALKKAICFDEPISLDETWEQLYDAVVKAIDNAPTVERPQGEWVYNDYGNGCGNWHCSECGTIIFMCKNSNNNFCPHCGAEMKTPN